MTLDHESGQALLLTRRKHSVPEINYESRKDREGAAIDIHIPARGNWLMDYGASEQPWARFFMGPCNDSLQSIPVCEIVYRIPGC